VMSVVIPGSGVVIVSAFVRGAMTADIVSATTGMVYSVMGVEDVAHVVMLRGRVRKGGHESEKCCRTG
jgi:hypothetical protein